MLWVFIILLFTLVGPIAWYLAGRPHPTTGGRPGPGRRQRRRPLAPDDDPEFLNHLAAKAQHENAERLRAWEEDLRRREQELRRQERPDGEEEQTR